MTSLPWKLALSLLAIVPSVNGRSKVEWWATKLDKSKRLEKQSNPSITKGKFENSQIHKFTIQDIGTRQAVYGYGGSLTETSAYLLKGLKDHNDDQYWSLMEELFGTNTTDDTLTDHSAAMRVVRVPISSSDFGPGDSTDDYWTFDDVAGDDDLNHIELGNAPDYLWEVLDDILTVQPEISIMLCPWTAPVWMKDYTSEEYDGWGSGHLSTSKYDIYGRYLWTVISKMKLEKKINVRYLAIQNEPLHAWINYPAMKMDAEEQANFLISLYNQRSKINSDDNDSDDSDDDITSYLKTIGVVIFDHNWIDVSYPIEVLRRLKSENMLAYRMVSGAAFHCYDGDVSQQSELKDDPEYSDKELYFTECSGSKASNWYSNIDWNTWMLYKGGVMDYGSTMVMHWNIVLDQYNGSYNGGYCSNCRGIITLNTSNWEVTYNEEYYGVAHFGKFVSNDGNTRTVLSNQEGPANCGNGVNGFINIAVFMNRNQRAMIINVNNLCHDYKSRTVVIQRQGRYNEEYVEIEAVPGLNTLRWT